MHMYLNFSSSNKKIKKSSLCDYKNAAWSSHVPYGYLQITHPVAALNFKVESQKTQDEKQRFSI